MAVMGIVYVGGKREVFIVCHGVSLNVRNLLTEDIANLPF